ncbi:hypothetical protein ABZ752_22820 [Streptomyces roseifaciens]
MNAYDRFRARLSKPLPRVLLTLGWLVALYHSNSAWTVVLGVLVWLAWGKATRSRQPASKAGARVPRPRAAARTTRPRPRPRNGKSRTASKGNRR